MAEFATDFVPTDLYDGGLVSEYEGDWCVSLHIPAQRRIMKTRLPANSLYMVRDGVVAIDFCVNRGRRQILDFLMPGDILSALESCGPSCVSFRAITKADLLAPSAGSMHSTPADEASACRDVLYSKLRAQSARATLNQVMIGTLDAEPRVAAFLLVMAMRLARGWHPNQLLPLPMSRDEIADHLAVNRDTLSRIMTRFEAQGIISRVNRRAIRLIDLEKLSELAVIAGWIAATLEPRSAAPTLQM